MDVAGVTSLASDDLRKFGIHRPACYDELWARAGQLLPGPDDPGDVLIWADQAETEQDGTVIESEVLTEGCGIRWRCVIVAVVTMGNDHRGDGC